MTDRDPMNDKCLQWVFEPLNYEIKAEISQFDWGDQKEIEKLLDNKKVDAIARSTITVGDGAVGRSTSGTLTKEVNETFTYGFTETIGLGIEVEMEAGFPGLGSAKTKLSTKFEFAAKEEFSKSQNNSITHPYQFRPEKTGVYEAGMIVYVVDDSALKFTANVSLTAVDDDDKKYPGKQIKALLYYGGFNCKIERVNRYSVEAKIHGYMKAKFAVDTEVYAKRIEEIPVSVSSTSATTTIVPTTISPKPVSPKKVSPKPPSLKTVAVKKVNNLWRLKLFYICFVFTYRQKNHHQPMYRN